MGRQLRSGDAGFTLMELLVVLFIIALLGTVALPSVTQSLTRAREAALRENLQVMRRAIDDYRADTGEYPEQLNVLVVEKYLRFIPDDPVAGANAVWMTTSAETGTGIVDLHSSSSEMSLDQTPYDEW